MARCDADDCRPRVGTCSVPPGTHHPCSHVTRGSGLTPRRDGGTCQPPGSWQSISQLNARPVVRLWMLSLPGATRMYAVAPRGFGTLLKLDFHTQYHQLIGAYPPEKPSSFTMAGSHDYIIATSQARQPGGAVPNPPRLQWTDRLKVARLVPEWRNGTRTWGLGGGIGGGLGNPIHHGIAPLTRPCCLFMVSRGLVNTLEMEMLRTTRRAI